MASVSFASETALPPSVPSPSLTIQDLRHALVTRLQRVPEYRFIQKEADRMGVKVYLFGGTAAAYAHYVKWDLLREMGDLRFQPDRFDYDFTHIYRSNQDLDIVVDGSAEQIKDLQIRLQEVFPHFQGAKEAWEVRSLREKVNGKMALLDNPDFLHQNTDSNSVGLIAINESNELLAVRDLREWDKSDSQFLKDIVSNQLHYYQSKLHPTTELARAGRNPEIFSVIRYLIKVVQFELDMNAEDLSQIQKVIEQFDPANLVGDTAYQTRWFENNSVKLIQNAVNIEYAWNLTEKFGLRKKLIALSNNAGTIGSMAWWLSREPLRSKAVGQGRGRSAKDLKIDVVAHETTSFSAYESITRAHTGEANVLISRENVPGETALLGEGFYTRVGRIGAKGTGLTVRFHLDPSAIDGIDFRYYPENDYVVVINKSALRVIPESLSLGPLEYFQMIDSFDHNEKGVLEKLKRRLANQVSLLSAKDLVELTDFLMGPATSSWTIPQLGANTPFIPHSIREVISSGIINLLPQVKAALFQRPDCEQGALSYYFLDYIQNSGQQNEVLMSELDQVLTKKAATIPRRKAIVVANKQPNFPKPIGKVIENGLIKKLPKLRNALLRRALQELKSPDWIWSELIAFVRRHQSAFAENSQTVEFEILYQQKMIMQLRIFGKVSLLSEARTELVEFVNSESFAQSDEAKELYTKLFLSPSLQGGFGGLNLYYQIQNPKVLAQIAKLVPSDKIDALVGPDHQIWRILDPFKEEIKQRLLTESEARSTFARLIRQQMAGIWTKSTYIQQTSVTPAPNAFYSLSAKVLEAKDFLSQFSTSEIFELLLISQFSHNPKFHQGFPSEITPLLQAEWDHRKRHPLSLETQTKISTILKMQFEFDLGYRLSQIIDPVIGRVMKPSDATMMQILYGDFNERVKALKTEMPLTALTVIELVFFGKLISKITKAPFDAFVDYQQAIIKKYLKLGSEALTIGPRAGEYVGGPKATSSLAMSILRSRDLFQACAKVPMEFAAFLLAYAEPSLLRANFPMDLATPEVGVVFEALKKAFETHPSLDYRIEASTEFIDPFLRLNKYNKRSETLPLCSEQLK
jgi:hypothetical protein